MIKYPYCGKGEKVFQDLKQNYDNGFLFSLYREMLRIRLIEEEIERRYCEDEMKTPIHLVIGQEASSVGVCAALNKDDLIYSSHRTHGNYLAKGGDLKKMLSEFYCRINGCAGSRGGSMHLLDKNVGMAGSSAIVAGSLPIATGAALSAQLLKKEHVVAVFFGDAATEEGVVWESLNFAALRKLPVIFVCENNFYSVCSNINVRQPKVKIYKKAESFGLKSFQVDGCNVLDVFETAQEAVKLARTGNGPTFIESIAYRWRGHGGAGDDSASGYRDPGEVAHWQAFCPIKLLGDYLEKQKAIDQSSKDLLTREIKLEIDEAFNHAISSPNPEEKDLDKFVYSEPHNKMVN